MQTNESYRDHVNTNENSLIDAFYIGAKTIICIVGAWTAGCLVGSIFDKFTNASRSTIHASKIVED